MTDGYCRLTCGVCSPAACPAEGYIEAQHNCNCGDRLANFASGKKSAELCGAECASRADCASFGVWTGPAKGVGHCALFDQACTSTCSKPTTLPWTNKAYNKCEPSPTAASPTASPTPAPTPSPMQ